VDQNSYVKVMDDVNGDGKKDVIVTGGNQKVMILSGVDGTSIFEETFDGGTGTAQLGEYNNAPGDEILTSVGNVVHAIEIPPLSEQRAALIDLYNSTNGDSWTDNSGWKEPPLAPDGFSEAGECSVDNPWYGVTCSSGNVTQIVLDNNNLAGTIPASIGDLTHLQLLWLFDNQLTGSIPMEMGNLVDLQWLYLFNNQLSGSIPSELENLSNLQGLYIHSNQFDGTIPAELGNLTNLKFLTLNNNQLTGSTPTELETLVNL